MYRIENVLIADDIEQECLTILQNNGVNVVKKTKQTKEQLLIELPKYDAVIVRSATKITRELIEAASGKLSLIGRAGTGVDNIDVPAATEHGVIVMNTPDAGMVGMAFFGGGCAMALEFVGQLFDPAQIATYDRQ
uniref:2-Hacid_dh domain-containing protein n=1 Tax=Steinernema glaseri TaxID=37863 RepID=A0A1I7ZEE0_9BILA